MAFSIEAGLKALKPYVPQDDQDTWKEFQTYEAQLLENLRNERLFGGTDTLRSARSSVIYNLNPLAFKLTGVSFNDLCQGVAPVKPPPPPPQTPPPSPAPQPLRTLQTGDPDFNTLVDLLAKKAAAAPVGSKQFFRNLVDNSKLPAGWKQDITDVWSGSARSDALTLIKFVNEKGTNPDNKRYTALGSVLDVLIRNEAGLEDAATLAALIVSYRLYRSDALLNDLILRYQIPRTIQPAAAPEYGPDIHWQGPTDERELQSFFDKEPPDFLAISFLQRAIELAASVCKIEVPSMQRTGTGFLVADDLLLTNYHVLKDAPNENIDANAHDLILRFGYFTETLNGDPAAGRVLKLAEKDPIVDRSSVNELDYVLLRVEDAIMDTKGIHPLKAFEINPPAPHAHLHILQHPAGKVMQLAPSSNGVTSVDTNTSLIQYITRTLGGSSGAPCFDENWRLVALHHAERSKDFGFGTIREGILFGPIYQRIQQYL